MGQPRLSGFGLTTTYRGRAYFPTPIEVFLRKPAFSAHNYFWNAMSLRESEIHFWFININDILYDRNILQNSNIFRNIICNNNTNLYGCVPIKYGKARYMSLRDFVNNTNNFGFIKFDDNLIQIRVYERIIIQNYMFCWFYVVDTGAKSYFRISWPPGPGKLAPWNLEHEKIAVFPKKNGPAPLGSWNILVW